MNPSNALTRLARKAVAAPLISAFSDSTRPGLKQCWLMGETVFEKLSDIGAAYNWPGHASAVPIIMEEVISGVCSAIRQEENQT